MDRGEDRRDEGPDEARVEEMSHVSEEPRPHVDLEMAAKEGAQEAKKDAGGEE